LHLSNQASEKIGICFQAGLFMIYRLPVIQEMVRDRLKKAFNGCRRLADYFCEIGRGKKPGMPLFEIA
jgi:hypothetical protein